MTLESRSILIAAALALGASGCMGAEDGGEPTGSATLTLTRAPEDASCLKVEIEGATRSVTRTFDLVPGQASTFRLERLPTGLTQFRGDAYAGACDDLTPGAVPTWSSEPVDAFIRVVESTHVVLRMVQNGRASVGVDFDPENGDDPSPTAPGGGSYSSQDAYVVPVADGVVTEAIFTVGDSANLGPNGVTPYRMVGIPDGLGAFDNGDGTFTLLSNHELGGGAGVARAHGGIGAFVSRWRVRKTDLAVLHGEDLIQNVVLWNSVASAYAAPTTGTVFSRFCSADLPERSAFFDAVSALGYDGRLFLTGEESGAEGRAFAHTLDGTSYELPALGKMSFENVVANPARGMRTVVVSLDDSSGGQIFVYAGDKTDSGNPAEMAGLAGGTLYAVKVDGVLSEDPATGIADGPFSAVDLGDVRNSTGAALEAASVAAGVTAFNRPEDGAWDPNDPDSFYFVTTASFVGNSRLWRLSFVDAARPELGGTIEMLLDGTEGQRMFDNMTIDKRGHLLAQEDPGGQDHLAKVWRYDFATGELTVIAQHDPALFTPGAAQFLTRDEESSGIIDASDLLGEGWFLLDVQVHRPAGDAELVEGGQFVALYDPATTL